MNQGPRRRSPNRDPGVKQEIVDAARRLIVERGIGRMSLADIASSAGVSKGTLYYYFPTKRSLVFEISRVHMEAVSGKLIRWVETTGADVPPELVLRRVFQSLISSAPQGLTHLYLMQEALSGDESIREGFVQAYRDWRSRIERGFEALAPGQANNKPLAALVLAAIDGFLLQNLVGAEELRLEEVSRLIMTMAKGAR